MILTACGGFLLAVLWMDLMFDVQVRGHRGAEIPEPVLGSIAAYYRRVTTTARPMTHLVGTVMAIAIGTLVVQIARDDERRGIALLSLLLAGAPIALAMARTYPNAVRLGARADAAAEQSRLARAICRDHVLCMVAIVAFIVLQLATALR
ncbi:MAG TPA: hypothetical protein VMS22_14785 [Candidatus Eisenbacteria bacterium]|nr:hypothetical protein [Candidatus Eisenbacteria bacterium]